jgi:hypothetical protein
MAERPVFVPRAGGPRLVDDVTIAFPWHPGLSPSQKKKNIVALHQAAAEQGLRPLLEISGKSQEATGRSLSAFSLAIRIGGRLVPLEGVFQGSKVFEHGGPFADLIGADSRDAKRDPRLRESGALCGFQLEGRRFPLQPPTAFYDWLYISALMPDRRSWLARLEVYAGFTDIEFNPKRSLNCQARAAAAFLALAGRGRLEEAMNFEAFRRLLSSIREA